MSLRSLHFPIEDTLRHKRHVPTRLIEQIGKSLSSSRSLQTRRAIIYPIMYSRKACNNSLVIIHQGYRPTKADLCFILHSDLWSYAKGKQIEMQRHFFWNLFVVYYYNELNRSGRNMWSTHNRLSRQPKDHFHSLKRWTKIRTVPRGGRGKVWTSKS